MRRYAFPDTSFHFVRQHASHVFDLWLLALAVVAALVCGTRIVAAAEALRAGTGRVDITDREAGPVNDPLYVKALVLETGDTRAALITVDAVAIGEIGYIGNDYLVDIRAQLERQFQIRPTHLLVNASHCHGIIQRDIRSHTVKAVAQAVRGLAPVRIGVGVGHEDRVQENRRMQRKDGSEVDVRHAYSMPPDEEVAAVGPIDPEIGILRLDRLDGTTLAIVYNFACHPIQGVPSGANTADLSGFACRTIEESFGDSTTAFFVQGCAGDINPVSYKAVDVPRHAEPLGTMLGASVVKAARRIRPVPLQTFRMRHSVLSLPRADYSRRIDSLKKRRMELLDALQGTTLNLKTFMQLSTKYALSPQYPSYYAYGYLHQKQQGREDLRALDAANRKAMKAYLSNIYTMEELTRINTNLRLLRKHQQQAEAAKSDHIDVELFALRINDWVLLTFPGELTVEIGLSIKKRSPFEHTFVAGYTNGYIYYAPTSRQLGNQGGAQEDSDTLLAPAWQAIFEERARQMLHQLE